MKLLKDIRDSLRGGVRLPGPDDNNDNNNDDNDNDDDNDNGDNNNDNDDNDNGDKFLEYQEVISSSMEEIINVKSDGERYVRFIAYQNETIEKLEKELTDRKYLTKNIIDETSKIINEHIKERIEYHNKYKNILFD